MAMEKPNQNENPNQNKNPAQSDNLAKNFLYLHPSEKTLRLLSYLLFLIQQIITLGAAQLSLR